MGNRAVVTFHTDGTDYSPAIYLHWSGSEVPDLLRRATPQMRKHDPSYSAARFCGFCHEEISGNTGLGLLAPPNPGTMALEEYCSFNHYGRGDAGVFFVNVSTGEIRQFGGHELTLPKPLDLPA